MVAVEGKGESSANASTLVGRDHERRTLEVLFENARSGNGRLILIGGEAGVGKTTILEDFIIGVRDGDVTVLTGSCYDVASPPPYGPWREAMVTAPDSSPSETSSGIEWFDDVRLNELPDQTSLFSKVLSSLRELASSSPLIVALEDVHWSDHESLELLRFVGRSIRDIPVMVIATYRNDELSADHPLYLTLPHLVREARAERLDVRRFPESTIRDLVEQRYRLPPDDCTRLVNELGRRTDGNPFFIIELLRSMEQSELLVHEDGRWRLSQLTETEVPLLVRQVIDRRFLQLDESARTALQTAAILGYEVRSDLWMSLVDEDEASLSRIVQLALDAWILEQSPHSTHLRFRHALVQEVLYSTVPLPLRRLQHRRIAELLAEMPGADSAMVAEHFQRAGDARAPHWLLRAARRARQLFAPYAIIQNLNPAIDAADSMSAPDLIEALQLRGWAHEISGDFDEANRDYLLGLNTALESGDRHAEWNALIHLAELWAGRDYSRTGEYIEQALHVAEQIANPVQTAYSLNRLGNWHMNQEDPDRALEHHNQALEIYQQIRDQSGIAATVDLLGMTCVMGGNLIDGVRHYDRAIDLFQSLDNRQLLSSSMANATHRGANYLSDTAVATRSSLDECVDFAERALAIASEIDYRPGEVFALIRLSSCLGPRGDFERARDALHDSIRRAEEIDHRQWLSAAHGVGGLLFLDFLDAETARDFAERAHSIAVEIGSGHWIRCNAGILIVAHLALGDMDAAGELFRKTFTDDLPARTMAQRQVWCARIQMELLQREYDHALQSIDRVIANTPFTSVDRLPVRLALLRAEALIETERYDEAGKTLEFALSIATSHGARSLLWRVRRMNGILFQRTGERQSAASQFLQARQTVEEIASAITTPRDQQQFRSAALALIPENWTPTSLQSAKLAFGGLTRRQREVAALVADGCTNREIADTLSISERTVESHITAILSTLDLSSRVQIVAWCRENSLPGYEPDETSFQN